VWNTNWHAAKNGNTADKNKRQMHEKDLNHVSQTNVSETPQILFLSQLKNLLLFEYFNRNLKNSNEQFTEH